MAFKISLSNTHHCNILCRVLLNIYSTINIEFSLGVPNTDPNYCNTNLLDSNEKRIFNND